jgi:hypothetical protein
MGAIAIGFAVLEDVMYYISSTETSYKLLQLTGDNSDYRSSLQTIALLRFFPGHLFFDVIAVYFIARKSQQGLEIRSFSLAFFAAVIMHGIWNSIGHISIWLWIIYVLLLLFLTIRVIRYVKSISRFHPLNINMADRLLLFKKQVRDHHSFSYHFKSFLAYLAIGAAGVIVAFLLPYILIGAIILLLAIIKGLIFGAI